MTKFVVFAEEPSGRIVAECLAASLGFADRALFLQHQGKSDLEASFPRKIISWGAPQPPKFIVMRDNDGADCVTLKKRLLNFLPVAKLNSVKVRLVMQELESWYLGDLDAVANAGVIGKQIAEAQKHKAKFRNPDRLNNAKQIFRKLTGMSGQIALARSIGPHLNLANNTSPSFHHFVSALKWASA